MLERLISLIVRLKEVFLRMEESRNEAYGNEAEIAALTAEMITLKKDQSDAMKALDELEEVIKKWET